jgi:hypothetical protein
LGDEKFNHNKQQHFFFLFFAPVLAFTAFRQLIMTLAVIQVMLLDILMLGFKIYFAGVISCLTSKQHC